MEIKKETKSPVRLEQQPIQLEMFKSISMKETDSQSLRLWDSLSNAIFEDKKAVKRIDGCFLKSIEETINFEEVEVRVEKHPARIKKGNGFVDIFPQKKEYKIMEVLIKLAVDEIGSGFYKDNEPTLHFGLRINLHSIYKLIKGKTGKSKYSYSQILEAIDILSMSHITLKAGNNVIKGSLITSYIGNNITDSKKSSFLLCFHPIISKLIQERSFRQFNISRSLMQTDIFTSFLYKKFVHKFKQASNTNNYHFLLSSILLEVPSLRKWKNTERKIIKIKDSLNSLTDDVVLSYKAEKKYEECNGGKRTIDCKFTVKFTKTFIDEQIKANKVKNSSIIYNDDGTVFEYPKFSNYKEKYSDNKKAHTKYMLDLERWHEKNNQRKNNKESIVHRAFKKLT